MTLDERNAIYWQAVLAVCPMCGNEPRGVWHPAARPRRADHNCFMHEQRDISRRFINCRADGIHKLMELPLNA